MEALKNVNLIIGILFTVCYLYQFIYIPIPWLLHKRKTPKPTDMHHHFAVLICARNEENVIGALIDSLHCQTYCRDNLHIFVLADNCRDHTAAAARAAGAEVYERFDSVHVGKGFALDCLLKHLRRDYPDGFDGYFVFDADNVLRPNYVEQMDRVFSEGHDIVTSYRNSKNYGDNWISAGYALWFLRESRYLNHSRYLLGTSCAVSGTGFLFSRAVAQELGGWPFHTLTEDIEFSAYQITHGRKIAFCADAELFDEQPVTFSQSWRQRLRWSRGFLQVFKRYGGSLIRGIFRGSFSCFDMTMTIMPAFFLTVIALICNTALCVWCLLAGGGLLAMEQSGGMLLLEMYLTLFVIGAITTVTERRRIHTETAKKCRYLFTFPVFMFTYIPISVAALFVDPGWKPICHSVSFDPRSAGSPAGFGKDIQTRPNETKSTPL